MSLLAPYEPTAEDPFDLRKAGHLLRRAAFGGSLRERRALIRVGVEKAVDRMFVPGDGEDLDGYLPDVLALGEIGQLRAYRVWRALDSSTRLREKMSLFWHGHFATSNQKVKNTRMMGRQLALFDQLGLGRFDDLVLAVSRDPAMVRWLDSETNVRGEANENYARELFELFTLGEGNYTERDVQQAARSFTGWHLRGEEFVFKRAYHDDGDKTLFGETGQFSGEDVVAMTVRHPASAAFIAKRLLVYFVHPEPTREEVEALAATYTEQDRHVGRTLRVLLGSRLFFSARAYRSKIKSPVDFVVGLVRCLGGRASPNSLSEAITQMGQALLEPPNVAGWKDERSWITSATWLVRSNFAATLFSPRFKMSPTREEILPPDSPEGRARRVLELLLDSDVSVETRRKVERFAADEEDPAGLIHAVQCLPEGQML